MKGTHEILIVDDDRSFANSLKDVLEKWHPNWIIATVYDVKSAIEYVCSNSVEVVLVDWKLDEHDPKIRGDKIIEAVRRKDPLCGILLVSGLLEEVRDKYGMESAHVPDDYIHKTIQGRNLAKELSFKITLMLRRGIAHREASYSRHIDSRLKLHYGGYLREAKLSSRWITAVFTDIRGFSRVAHSLKDQNRVVAPFLKDLYQLIVRCTHQYSGIVDKFMGDGAMLLFGALGKDGGIAGKAHAVDAVNAALAMRREWKTLLANFSTKAREAGAHPFCVDQLNFGIGIHTAEVLIGVIRTEERDQFTAVGHGINMAKRYESFAGKKDGKHEWGSILISSTTEVRVKSDFQIEPQPRFSAKGTDTDEWCWKIVEL